MLEDPWVIPVDGIDNPTEAFEVVTKDFYFICNWRFLWVEEIPQPLFPSFQNLPMVATLSRRPMPSNIRLFEYAGKQM